MVSLLFDRTRLGTGVVDADVAVEDGRRRRGHGSAHSYKREGWAFNRLATD